MDGAVRLSQARRGPVPAAVSTENQVAPWTDLQDFLAGQDFQLSPRSGQWGDLVLVAVLMVVRGSDSVAVIAVVTSRSIEATCVR